MAARIISSLTMAQQDNIVLRFEFPLGKDTGEIRTLNIFCDQGRGSPPLHLYKVCSVANNNESTVKCSMLFHA